MKLVLSAIAVPLWIVSTAAGADGGGTWTARQASTNVQAAASVRLPPELEKTLEAELDELVHRWRILEATASEQDGESGGVMGSFALLSPVHNARYKLSTAQNWVRDGVPIAKATCAGVGRHRAGRFTRFRCTVISARLEIAAPQAVWEGDRITSVRYDAPRIVGSFRATLAVTVTGRSTLTFQQIGRSSRVDAGCSTAECRDGDTRSVVRENDTGRHPSYAPDMTDRTRREHTMKRIVAISAVVAGLAIPSVANAAAAPQLVKPQLVKPALVKSQLVRSQLVKPQLVRSQIVSSQRAQALRFSWQLRLLRR